MEKLYFVLAGLCLVCLPSCGGGDETPATPIELCKSYFRSSCERAFACALAEDIGYSSESECREQLANQFCPRVRDAAVRGTLIIDEVAAKRCTKNLDSARCAEASGVFQSTDCQEWLIGQQAKSEPCEIGDECGEDSARCFTRTSGEGVCSGVLRGESYELDCSRPTVENCPGLVCIELNDNLQNKTGICSALCDEDADCGEGGRCIDFEGDVGKRCLSKCASDEECSNGFICLNETGMTSGACLVRTP